MMLMTLFKDLLCMSLVQTFFRDLNLLSNYTLDIPLRLIGFGGCTWFT